MNYPFEYSEKEQKLIEALNFQTFAKSPNLPPPLLYNCMALECFRLNKNDKIADSVRNCLLALEDIANASPKMKIYRLTPEFDDLIQI